MIEVYVYSNLNPGKVENEFISFSDDLLKRKTI